MLLKHLLLGGGIAMFVVAAGILTADTYLLIAYKGARLCPDGATPAPPPGGRWRTGAALVMLAWSPLLISAAMVIVLSRG